MSEKDTRTPTNRADEVAENSGETDFARADADVAKLATDLEDLRQTLLRRQADFDNYKKRIDKERSEDSKRTTARLIEALIPVIDGFEQALAAHREAEYENYRRGLVRRFPYAVFYEYTTVTVYGIFHTSRNPDKWRQRLP